MKIYRAFLTPQPEKIIAACAAGHSVCVPPNMLDFATGDVASFAGYPTGNHHQLVKASEARLAAQQGARLIIAVPSIISGAITGASSTDLHEPLMAEIVLLREAVPHPTTLAIVVDTQKFDNAQALALATVAKNSGADAICTGVTESRPHSHPALASVLPVIAIGQSPACAQEATIWLNTNANPVK